MDRMIRKLSMSLARSTTRRDFMSQLARGIVGAGMGAAFFFGGQRLAYASHCVHIGGTCGSCSGSSYDENGCITGISYCSTGNCNSEGLCTGNYPWQIAQWTCCCNNNLSTCRDCSANPQGPIACMCLSYTPSAC